MARLTPLYALIAAAALSVTAPAQAQSQNDAHTCQAFGSFGGIIVDYILPLSLRDFANMNAGRSPQLVQNAMSKIDRELSPQSKQALNQLGQENSSLLEEAASDFAMDLVLSGAADSRQAAANIMQQECVNTGPRQIIEFQRASYQNQDQNTGQSTGQQRAR